MAPKKSKQTVKSVKLINFAGILADFKPENVANDSWGGLASISRPIGKRNRMISKKFMNQFIIIVSEIWDRTKWSKFEKNSLINVTLKDFVKDQVFGDEQFSGGKFGRFLVLGPMFSWIKTINLFIRVCMVFDFSLGLMWFPRN